MAAGTQRNRHIYTYMYIHMMYLHHDGYTTMMVPNSYVRKSEIFLFCCLSAVKIALHSDYVLRTVLVRILRAPAQRERVTVTHLCYTLGGILHLVKHTANLRHSSQQC